MIMTAKKTTSLNRQRSAAGQNGFTLVEVLVALVIMTVGMLGVAVLFVEGLRMNRTSIYRTTAVSLAADMAERIRANDQAMVAYAGAGPGANNNCVHGPGTCTRQQLAADDWFRWNQMLTSSLPVGANALIQVNLNTPTVSITRYAITLQWQETGKPGMSSYTLRVQI